MWMHAWYDEPHHLSASDLQRAIVICVVVFMLVLAVGCWLT
jgi:hypothetical protein